MQHKNYSLTGIREDGCLIKYQLNPEDQKKLESFAQSLFNNIKPKFTILTNINPNKQRIRRIPTALQDDVKIFCKRKKQERYTFKSIGNMIGKDHSTVMHQISKYNDLFKVDPGFRRKVENFCEEDFLKRFNEYRENLSKQILNENPIQ